MNLIVEKHVPIAMRDDVTLSGDVYRPHDGAPPLDGAHPYALLQR